ncbi:hypothetical protein GGI07_002612 [Coemansia sp. Benny D115]|nr:hypothetical protein GGI07_002612 [Coemansia sp. Benny D115]
MQLSSYPHLTRAEFDHSIACFAERYAHALQHRYGQSVHVATAPRGPLAAGAQRYLCIGGDILAAAADPAEAPCMDAAIEDADPAAPRLPAPATAIGCGGRVEYHVAYSPTWRVPQLLVRVSEQLADGSLAPVFSVARALELLRVDAAVRGALAAVEFGGALSVADHPVLGVPWLAVHPCQTAGLLATVGAVGADDYVAAWASLVGCAVGLALPAVRPRGEAEGGAATAHEQRRG